MKNNRITTKQQHVAAFALVAATGGLLAAGAEASPIVVQPGSPAMYKYLPAPTPASAAAAAPSGTVVCVPASGSTTPPAGTTRVEAILVGGGGAGANGAVVYNSRTPYGGGGGGSGYITTASFAYTSGAINIVIGAGGLGTGSTPTLRAGRATTLTYGATTYTASGGAGGSGVIGGAGGSGGGGSDLRAANGAGGGGGAGYKGVAGYPPGGASSVWTKGYAGGANGGSGAGNNGGAGQGFGYGGTPGVGYDDWPGGNGHAFTSPAAIDVVSPCITSTTPGLDIRAEIGNPYISDRQEATGYGAGGSGGGCCDNSSVRIRGASGAQGVVLMRYLTTP